MSDAADASRLIAALVSPRCGIVTALVPQMRGPQEPTPPHLWNATLAHFSTQQTQIGVRVTGGKGRTEAEAKLSALGEAMERYASFQWDPARVRIGQADENAITPDDCVLYSKAQHAAGCPFPPWSPKTPTSWITGTELPDGNPVEMPASQVYALGPPPRMEDFFTPSASNGMAAGKDLDHAILGGLHEVIERDAFMITWLNKLPARKIKLPDRGCTAAATIRHYDKFGVKIRLMWLHTDQSVYVMMAIAEDPQDGGIFRVIGLGCDGDPVVAVDKAVSELCQLRAGMVMRMQMDDYEKRLTGYEAVQ
ncbi:MAG: YcaO-like family protein, partial [Pseudomonadota bacterium]